MNQKDCLYILKGWMYFVSSWVNQLKDQFQLAVRALMNVLALSFKFEPKPENPKKTKTQMFLNSRSDQKILWKIFYKKLLLRKCHVRFILHVALAAEGYIRGKVIILHLQSFVIYDTCFVSGINYTGGMQIKTCFLGSSYHL